MWSNRQLKWIRYCLYWNWLLAFRVEFSRKCCCSNGKFNVIFICRWCMLLCNKESTFSRQNVSFGIDNGIVYIIFKDAILWPEHLLFYYLGHGTIFLGFVVVVTFFFIQSCMLLDQVTEFITAVYCIDVSIKKWSMWIESMSNTFATKILKCICCDRQWH